MSFNNYVYIMVSYKNRIIKIGISKDPERRLKEIRRDKNDHSCYYLMSARIPKSACGFKEEYMMHDFFNDYRVGGEWFDAKILQDAIYYLYITYYYILLTFYNIIMVKYI